MFLLKSRNTLVISAVLFLLVVILLRLSSLLIKDNVVGIVEAIVGGNMENIKIIDFASIDFSWIHPSNWSIDAITETLNRWMHDLIDNVMPAAISALNLTLVNVALVAKTTEGAGVVAVASL